MSADAYHARSRNHPRSVPAWLQRDQDGLVIKQSMAHLDAALTALGMLLYVITALDLVLTPMMTQRTLAFTRPWTPEPVLPANVLMVG